jgi:hypothetical protein
MNADIDLLQQDIEAAIRNYEERRKENRRKSANVAVFNACVAALTTVLISLSNIWKPTAQILNSCAIIASATVMIASGWDALFNHKKLWVLYTDKWVLMRELRTDLLHLRKTEPINQNSINTLYERYKAIVREFNDEWKDMKAAGK